MSIPDPFLPQLFTDAKPITPNNACEKKAYSKREANGVINARMKARMRKGKPDALRAYHCPRCNQWHVTHEEKRQ